MGVTLREVAARAKVSIGTVSAVINGSALVKEKTRNQVLKVVRDLNYRPNRLARSLRTKKTLSIGLIISDITNPFFPEIVRGAEDVAKKEGYNIILCNTDEDVTTGISSLNLLREKRVDGLILVGGVVPTEEIKELQEEGFPTVIVEREFDGLKLNTVLVDSKAGAYEATLHLINLGHRRIGFISGPLNRPPSLGRFEGYKLALKESGIGWDDSLVKEGDFRFNGGHRAMIQLLHRPQLPSAVFASNDLMAIGALEAIKSQGLSIPEDIAVVGYDDIPEASYTSPSLTTVALPKRRLGATAMELLLKILAGEEKTSQRIVLPTKLVIRKSCGANI